MALQPWTPQLVVRGFVQALLAADSGVLGQVAAGNIIPDVGIPSVDPPARTLAHGLTGTMRVAAAIGGTVTQVETPWDITGWEPSHSRLSLAPLMREVKRALIGAEMRGKRHLYTYDGQAYAIRCDVNLADPAAPLALDQRSAQTWAPVCERYRITVQPRAA